MTSLLDTSAAQSGALPEWMSLYLEDVAKGHHRFPTAEVDLS